MGMDRLAVLGIATALMALPTPAIPQSQRVVTVAPITTEIDCRLYESWWGWWLVLECRNNFLAIRSRLEAALAESGQVTVAGEGRNGRLPAFEIRGVVTELGTSAQSFATSDSASTVQRAVGRMDVGLLERSSNRIVVAKTVTASVVMNSASATDIDRGGSAMSPRAVYDEIQRKLALGAARMVAFHERPLAVTSIDGRDIVLNYGGSLVPIGTLVMVQPPSGRPVRYRVVTSGSTGAIAELDGDPGRIAIGSTVDFIDEDDPQSNGRRFRRQELPGF